MAKQELEVNKMVAEFMIFANQSVAEKVSFPSHNYQYLLLIIYLITLRFILCTLQVDYYVVMLSPSLQISILSLNVPMPKDLISIHIHLFFLYYKIHDNLFNFFYELSNIDTSSNSALAKSLSQAVNPADPHVNRLLRMLTTQAMTEAEYVNF